MGSRPNRILLINVRHGGGSVHRTVVHVGKESHIAKVGHKGIRLPWQDPFNVHKGETHQMEQNAGPNAAMPMPTNRRLEMVATWISNGQRARARTWGGTEDIQVRGTHIGVSSSLCPFRET